MFRNKTIQLQLYFKDPKRGVATKKEHADRTVRACKNHHRTKKGLIDGQPGINRVSMDNRNGGYAHRIRRKPAEAVRLKRDTRLGRRGQKRAEQTPRVAVWHGAETDGEGKRPVESVR